MRMAMQAFPTYVHVVRTSQHSWGFFEKLGFGLVKTEDNHWGPGLHLFEGHIQPLAFGAF
jgi:hypothetical protein